MRIVGEWNSQKQSTKLPDYLENCKLSYTNPISVEYFYRIDVRCVAEGSRLIAQV